VFEDDDRIVRVADQVCATNQARRNLPQQPLVQHLVQVDVAKIDEQSKKLCS
jgi:hypothetical protein